MQEQIEANEMDGQQTIIKVSNVDVAISPESRIPVTSLYAFVT